MNVTELAHWRYRVPALKEDIQRINRLISSIDPFIAVTITKEIDAAYDKLAYTNWLLEEAKYMCELGALTLD